ncbi:MAG TPA: hypothetical protein ACQGQH_04065 [Xylella sp.]
MMQRADDLVRLECEPKQHIFNTEGGSKIRRFPLYHEVLTRRVILHVTLVDIHQHTATLSTTF